MQIDPKTPIAGIQPAKLKKICRAEHFSVGWFVKAVGITEGEAPDALRELRALGWIAPDPYRGWKTTGVANRLAATPLLPRLQMDRARELVRRVVDEACLINDDLSHSFVVLSLRLFGSTLEGGRDGTVGDVDIGYVFGPRFGPSERQSSLHRVERSTAPNYLAGQCWVWPGLRLKRRLKVARRVSLHGQDELDSLRIPSTLIFSRDAGSRCRRATVLLPWEQPNDRH